MLDIRKWLAIVAAMRDHRRVDGVRRRWRRLVAGSASVRLVNATLTHASIDLLANGSVAVAATPIDNVSGYAGVPAGSPALQVNDSATGSALATLAPSVGKDAHYVVIAYESGGVLRTTRRRRRRGSAGRGHRLAARLRRRHRCRRDRRLRHRPGDRHRDADLADLHLPDLDVAAGERLPGDRAGHLPRARHRQRQPARPAPRHARGDVDEPASRCAGPDADDRRHARQRRRLGAAGRLHRRSQHERADPPRRRGAERGDGLGERGRHRDRRQRRGAVGRRLRARPGGRRDQRQRQRRLGRRARGVVPGRDDSTLLVYGSAAAPTASLIADDNHLPTTSGNLKLRLLNGLTGAASPLALDAAFAVVASNVLPGTASPYAVIASSTALRVDVFSPASLTPIYSNAALSVPGNAVYTLFMLGDAATPIPLLRRDR